MNNYCVYCQDYVGSWLPYRDGFISPVLEKLEVIGSDLINFYCPRCECFDRERHLFLYFDALSLWDKIIHAKVLHIAPELNLSKLIASKVRLYLKGDLQPQDESIMHVDLTKTNFSDNQFDLVIANHVLEHIEKDKEALFEIFRILKPGGFAILQAPFSLLLPNALECRDLKDERLRNFLFGQEDHVRLYGMDYFERMRNVGFNVELIDHSKILTLIDSAKYGVNSKEPLIIAKK